MKASKEMVERYSKMAEENGGTVKPHVVASFCGSCGYTPCVCPQYQPDSVSVVNTFECGCSGTDSRCPVHHAGTAAPHAVMMTRPAEGATGGTHADFVKHTPTHWSLTWYGIVVAKPRMTQRDKWAKRPAVMRYRAFCDSLRAACGLQGKLIHCPKEVNWRIYLPMPKSWTKKRKEEYSRFPHRVKPDRDNLDKAILDALFVEDSGIYSGILKKYWEDEKGPRLELEVIW